MKEFRESQKFNQWWLWAIMLTLFVALGLNGIDIFERTESWLAFVGPGAIVLTMILMAVLELRTTITESGIEAYFWPFGRKRIFWSEIEGYRIKEYSPLKEFGGWGYRIGPHGKAFNMYGNMGLELDLKSGKKLMIGTQRPEELGQFLEWCLAEKDGLTDEMVSLKLKELRLNELD
ncbi:MAG: PH domain-containing protein [Bacteroidota bacterium]